jgi:phospholipid N-methyltransferase
LEAAEQPFHPDEIFCGIPPRVFNQKRSVAAAEFHFERLRTGKKLRQFQRLDYGTQLNDQIFRRRRLSFQIGNEGLKF